MNLFELGRASWSSFTSRSRFGHGYRIFRSTFEQRRRYANGKSPNIPSFGNTTTILSVAGFTGLSWFVYQQKQQISRLEQRLLAYGKGFDQLVASSQLDDVKLNVMQGEVKVATEAPFDVADLRQRFERAKSEIERIKSPADVMRYHDEQWILLDQKMGEDDFVESALIIYKFIKLFPKDGKAHLPAVMTNNLEPNTVAALRVAAEIDESIAPLINTMTVEPNAALRHIKHHLASLNTHMMVLQMERITPLLLMSDLVVDALAGHAETGSLSIIGKDQLEVMKAVLEDGLSAMTTIQAAKAAIFVLPEPFGMDLDSMIDDIRQRINVLQEVLDRIVVTKHSPEDEIING